jgi:tRNA G18 (ribose-2'-O)-methylase SpoU
LDVKALPFSRPNGNNLRVATLRIQKIDSFGEPELQPYATMKRPLEHQRQGIFVAEGVKVVRRLLKSRFAVVSALLPEKWAAEFEPLLAARSEKQIPVYLAEKKLLEQLVGFSMFQGVLAVGRVPATESLDSILARSPSPRLFVAVDALTNAENLGTLVRNCAAFNVHALVVGETCSSPFLRRSVRSSMGTIFQVPVVEAQNLAQSLRELARLGVHTVAAHPHAEGRTLACADLSGDCCLVFGSEGYGIRAEVLAACDEAVAIPMPRTVDSLNVGAAAAVFLYEANRQRKRM